MTPRAWVAAGVAVVAVAIVGLEPWADRSLTGHMVQHLLLIAAAAPLLALAMPAVERPSWATLVVAGVVLQSAAMVGWHLPGPFQAAVEHDPLHGVEHVTLLATAVLFWWAVLVGREARVGMAVVAVFVAALVCTGVGAAMTLAGHPWYPAYRSLADQQMAGVVMWSIAGLVYLVAAVALFFTWLARLERAAPSRMVTSP